MSYHLYNTKGFVVTSWERKEADRVFLIFTEEFGMISAIATASRKVESKLRSNLADFSLGNFSLIRGKIGWRLTGASSEENCYFTLVGNRSSAKLFVKMVSFLRRMIPEEHEDKKLFQIFNQGYLFIRNELSNKNQVELTYLALVLKLLHQLGYVEEKKVGSVVSTDKISIEILEEINKNKKGLQLVVSGALAASHL